jgi:tRNA G18 (ribose-2'-O)-methylase SpoU
VYARDAGRLNPSSRLAYARSLDREALPVKRALVDGVDDPRVADYRNVRDADRRAADGLFLAEGRLNVKRLIEGGRYRTRSVFVTPAALAALRGSLLQLPDDVPVYVASRTVLNQVVGYDMHRGCLAAGERGALPSFDQQLASEAASPRLWLALEDVTNPDNVGGIFRNALAFGVERLLLSSRCADPLYRKCIRVSMGAALRLPFGYARDLPGELLALRDAGFVAVALVADRDATPVSSLAFEKRAKGVVLVLGNEGEGLSDAVRFRCDLAATIPMAPGVDSLNAATACGIALQRVSAELGIVPA